MNYNVKMLDGDITVKMFPEAVQQMRDYARLCNYGCAFGATVWFDDNDFTIVNTFLMKQEANYSAIKPNVISWREEIKSRENVENKNEVFACMGVAKNNLVSVESDFTADDIKNIKESIGKLYNQYFYIRVNKDGAISVSLFDEGRRMVFQNIPWEIDCSSYGHSDAEVKESLREYVSASSTYYGGNSGSWNNNYGHTEPKVYKDAPINTKNPQLKELV